LPARTETSSSDEGTTLARLCSPAIGRARKNESGPGFVGVRQQSGWDR